MGAEVKVAVSRRSIAEHPRLPIRLMVTLWASSQVKTRPL